MVRLGWTRAVIDVDAALAWCDRWLDPDASLLWNPEGSYDELAPPRSLHLVPQSAWYAAGVLATRGDAVRAATIFDRLCSLQYDAPGAVWHGTFARFAETPTPTAAAVEWVDYDPNWRQFLGTTFALTLSARDGALAAALPAASVDRMRAAITTAIAGEPPDRVAPTYSNIALMRAWLESEHGDATRQAAAADYALEVVAAFDAFGAFEEYNSPTYYGIDLYALGLWARHSSSPLLRTEGARVEAALWRDIVRWWHPGMANLCGPWSRSYGMDMGSYAALVGLFIGGRAFPDIGPGGAPFDHSHDTTFAPMVELVGGDDGIPPDVRAALTDATPPVTPPVTAPAADQIVGERLVERRVTSTRHATGWLAPTVMFGGESGSSTSVSAATSISVTPAAEP